MKNTRLCFVQAGLLRTEHGEYWIEPSSQVPTDNSAGRPHIIFKRSAVDKVKAFHRMKREVDSRANSNLSHDKANIGKQSPKNINMHTSANKNRSSKEAMDKRRREYLEERRRRLEAMRLNPTEYRRHQARLRMEQRRLQSNSRSNSVETSNSYELSQSKSKSREKSLGNLRRIRNRRRRRKRSKNCATKQPPYQWRTKNIHTHNDTSNSYENIVRIIYFTIVT